MVLIEVSMIEGGAKVLQGPPQAPKKQAANPMADPRNAKFNKDIASFYYALHLSQNEKDPSKKAKYRRAAELLRDELQASAQMQTMSTQVKWTSLLATDNDPESKSKTNPQNVPNPEPAPQPPSQPSNSAQGKDSASQPKPLPKQPTSPTAIPPVQPSPVGNPQSQVATQPQIPKVAAASAGPNTPPSKDADLTAPPQDEAAKDKLDSTQIGNPAEDQSQGVALDAAAVSKTIKDGNKPEAINQVNLSLKENHKVGESELRDVSAATGIPPAVAAANVEQIVNRLPEDELDRTARDLGIEVPQQQAEQAVSTDQGNVNAGTKQQQDQLTPSTTQPLSQPQQVAVEQGIKSTPEPQSQPQQNPETTSVPQGQPQSPEATQAPQVEQQSQPEQPPVLQQQPNQEVSADEKASYLLDKGKLQTNMTPEEVDRAYEEEIKLESAGQSTQTEETQASQPEPQPQQGEPNQEMPQPRGDARGVEDSMRGGTITNRNQQSLDAVKEYLGRNAIDQSADPIVNATKGIQSATEAIRGIRKAVAGDKSGALQSASNLSKAEDTKRADAKIMEYRKAEAEAEQNRWGNLIGKAQTEKTLGDTEAAAAGRSFKRLDLEGKQLIGKALGIENAENLTGDELNIEMDNLMKKMSPKYEEKKMEMFRIATQHGMYAEKLSPSYEGEDPEGISKPEAKAFKSELRSMIKTDRAEVNKTATALGIDPNQTDEALLQQMSNYIDNNTAEAIADRAKRGDDYTSLVQQASKLVISESQLGAEYPESPISSSQASQMTKAFGKIPADKVEERKSILRGMGVSDEELDKLDANGLNKKFSEEIKRHVVKPTTKNQERQQGEADQVVDKITDQGSALTNDEYRQYKAVASKLPEQKVREIARRLGIPDVENTSPENLKRQIDDAIKGRVSKPEEDKKKSQTQDYIGRVNESSTKGGLSNAEATVIAKSVNESNAEEYASAFGIGGESDPAILVPIVKKFITDNSREKIQEISQKKSKEAMLAAAVEGMAIEKDEFGSYSTRPITTAKSAQLKSAFKGLSEDAKRDILDGLTGGSQSNELLDLDGVGLNKRFEEEMKKHEIKSETESQKEATDYAVQKVGQYLDPNRRFDQQDVEEFNQVSSQLLREINSATTKKIATVLEIPIVDDETGLPKPLKVLVPQIRNEIFARAKKNPPPNPPGPNPPPPPNPTPPQNNNGGALGDSGPETQGGSGGSPNPTGGGSGGPQPTPTPAPQPANQTPDPASGNNDQSVAQPAAPESPPQQPPKKDTYESIQELADAKGYQKDATGTIYSQKVIPQVLTEFFNQPNPSRQVQNMKRAFEGLTNEQKSDLIRTTGVDNLNGLQAKIDKVIENRLNGNDPLAGLDANQAQESRDEAKKNEANIPLDTNIETEMKAAIAEGVKDVPVEILQGIKTFADIRKSINELMKNYNSADKDDPAAQAMKAESVAAVHGLKELSNKLMASKRNSS